MNIYQKLIEVRKNVPYLQKTNTGVQYKYVGSSDVLGALRNSMDEHKLLVVPRVIKTNVLTTEGQNARGNKNTKYFTEAWLEYTIVNADNPEETITIPWYAQGLDTEGEKGVGKLLTYGEKYLFLKLFNIATDKDDPDAFQQQSGSSGKTKPAKSKVTQPAKNSSVTPKPAFVDDARPDWSAFWTTTRQLKLSKDDVIRESQPFFKYDGEDFWKMPGMDAKMLNEFLDYLKEISK